MNDQEWSRSRFWLCHFLHSRHVRQPIEWDSDLRLTPEVGDALRQWLIANRCKSRDDAWLVARAVHDCGRDPAYLQSLRLLVKERRYHDGLIDRVVDRCGGAPAPHRKFASAVGLRLGRVRRRWLGQRFEMSLLLLGSLVDLMILTMIGATCSDAAVAGALRNIAAEKRAHICFFTERLTWSYAEFQFLRRNARRLRLRCMWAVLLFHAGRRYRPVIRAAGSASMPFILAGFQRFEGLLESMVPYRREALLAALLAQRRDRFAKPDLR